ncbi:MAG: class A beta-lactamase-related serine hydrolase [Caldilinea sp. CFX5]|nr:class A beta-lactamase-related serine hydrolase [Caldilinea sp. CFX5]
MRQTSSSYPYQLLYDPSQRQLLPRRHRVRFLGTLLGVFVGVALLFWQPVTAAPPVAQPPPTPTPTITPLPLLQVGNGADAIRSYYHDPDGRYSVPVPQSWRSERQHDYLVLTSPQEQIQIYILAIPGANVHKAIAQAWRQVDPAFAMSPKYILEMPSLNDLEEIQTVTYDDGVASGELVLALGQQHHEIVYVVLTRGRLAAFEERAAQIRLIQSGFTLYSLSRSSLRRVEPQPVTAPLLAELEGYIRAVLQRYKIPGASVVVVQDDQVVYTQGFGVRTMGGQEPVLPSTQMMIGSIGKTMTTMMMASLVDEGLLTWDTPVVDLLPTFRVADPVLSRQLTVRNLVCSCTGVPRRDFELFFQGGRQSAEDVIASLQQYKLLTKFGETFQYSNQMVATGGYAAAAASGGHYGQLYEQYVAQMAQRIFTPIGMDRTTFSFAEVMAGANYAQPHSANLAMQLTALPLQMEAVVTPAAPAGGAWSTVDDLGRYLLTLLNNGIAPDGQQVVSPWNLGVTWQPQVPVSANTSYGLGWFVDNYKGLRLLHHGGNTLGFTADLAFLPEANVGIAVLTNAQGVNFVTEAIRYRFLELLYNQEPRYDDYAHYRYEILRQYLGESVNELGTVDMATVTSYLGRYYNEELGTMQLVLAGADLRLVINTLSVELRPQEDADNATGRYVIYSPPLAGIPVQLTHSETGKPMLVLGAGVTQYAFTQHPLPLAHNHNSMVEYQP